jgi:LPXTG-motif cell wall-anchored protein
MNKIIIGAIVGGVLAVAGGGWYFLKGKKDKPAPAAE